MQAMTSERLGRRHIAPTLPITPSGMRRNHPRLVSPGQDHLDTHVTSHVGVHPTESHVSRTLSSVAPESTFVSTGMRHCSRIGAAARHRQVEENSVGGAQDIAVRSNDGHDVMGTTLGHGSTCILTLSCAGIANGSTAVGVLPLPSPSADARGLPGGYRLG